MRFEFKDWETVNFVETLSRKLVEFPSWGRGVNWRNIGKIEREGSNVMLKSKCGKITNLVI